MTMLHSVRLALLFLAGAGLGICFFGGLAWTVRRWTMGGSVVLLAASFLLRSAVILLGFWLLARDHPDGWVACLLGFTSAKFGLQRAIPVYYWSSKRKEGHAPHH